ncbi:acyl-CoA dehydrogenase NM domain-like protein, partial [Clavulina sp. PMI_390]
MLIGLPQVINFGSAEMKEKVVPDILFGRKFTSLAVSEAFTGSDVAGIKCTATKPKDGSYWTINRTKKWITNGHFSYYFTIAGKTKKGLTVFLVERGPGIETNLIKTSYSTSAGMAFITFDNVQVPSSHMLGKEDKGLIIVLINFDHERWLLCCGSARSHPLAMEEYFKWAHQRKAFGKPLLEQAVVRQKLAGIVVRTEAIQNWLESLTYQMFNMSYSQQSEHLAG